MVRLRNSSSRFLTSSRALFFSTNTEQKETPFYYGAPKAEKHLRSCWKRSEHNANCLKERTERARQLYCQARKEPSRCRLHATLQRSVDFTPFFVGKRAKCKQFISRRDNFQVGNRRCEAHGRWHECALGKYTNQKKENKCQFKGVTAGASTMTINTSIPTM